MSIVEIKKRAGICPVCKKRNHPLAQDVPGDICDDCQQEIAKESCFIVCKTCGHLVAIMKAEIHKSGFVFEPGMKYTVDRCRFCDPRPADTIDIQELNQYLVENGMAKEFYDGGHNNV